MEVKYIEVFSEASNCAVVRMPGRQFPGIVVQGDSLFQLLSMAKNIEEIAITRNDEVLKELTTEIIDAISTRITQYEMILNSHDIRRPY